MAGRNACLACLVVALPVFAQEKFRAQYIFDEDEASLRITDLSFPSAQRGVATAIVTRKRSDKPQALLTSDGGKTWAMTEVKEPGTSLFFLDDSTGWMVTPNGLWKTEESGRSWKKGKTPSGIFRVYFRDAKRGWAVGSKKQVYETSDGGEKWQKVAAAAETKGRPEYTHFSAIAFANPDVGIIAGWGRPPRRRDDQFLPDWADPEKAINRAQVPTLTVMLETKDGGKTWTPSSASLFGQVTRLRLSPEGWGLGLVEFQDAFEFPSEVYFITWKDGKSKRLYAAKERRVTDAAIAGPKGPIYLAAVEQLGKLNLNPIPGRVHILRSADGATWSEIPVDYRAVARRVTLAVSGTEVWAATDTGMIMKLEK